MTSPRGVSKSPYCPFKREISLHDGLLTFTDSASFWDPVIADLCVVFAALGVIGMDTEWPVGVEFGKGSTSFLDAGA